MTRSSQNVFAAEPSWQGRQEHTYWSQVETVRTPDGPRQRTLCYLGELNSSAQAHWLTTIEADLQNYRPGQLLGFHRAVKSIAKHETVEVFGLAPNGIVVRSADGKELNISKRHAGSFDVLEARPIEVSPGDRLLLTANRRYGGLRITNGELVTVSAVDSTGRIQLEDRRLLPADYRSFAHGYAVTAHRSQGKTVDSVILSGDGMQKELFYVATSRGRHSVTVITSDKEHLQQTVGRSMARKSATELVRDKRAYAHRGMAMARAMVRRAAHFVQQAVSRPRKERARERGLSR